jgi:cysteamine dioxygenase
MWMQTVRADTISPEDVGLRDDNLEDGGGHGFFESSFMKGSARAARWAQPITYLHIYECDAFSVSLSWIFCYCKFATTTSGQ